MLTPPELKPIKLVDFTGTMKKILLAGEVHIGVIHDSGIWSYLPQKPPLNWVAPKERVLALEQVYSVAKGTDKKDPPWVRPVPQPCSEQRSTRRLLPCPWWTRC